MGKHPYIIIIFLSLMTAVHGQNITFRPLSDAEKHVIINKGTEPPFTGKYTKHKAAGLYCCKQCDAALYRSQDKFDSHCGWPSFDDEINGAVTRHLDADGRRTEITCTRCGGHLGHVFSGEHLTPKNLRHCVNSISLVFKEITDKETAYFASGCFWGVQYHFEREEGVIGTRVGYMGGHSEQPDYAAVCTGSTGHAESIEVIFDPSRTSYETLAKLFFETHDPTQENRQGPDIGTQYRSVVFYTNADQQATAQQLIAQLKEKGYAVKTAVEPAPHFYVAEDYHQHYYQKKRGTPYCHIYQKKF